MAVLSQPFVTLQYFTRTVITKCHRVGGLINRNYFLLILEVRIARSRHQQGWFLLRLLSLTCTWPSPFSVFIWSSLCVYLCPTFLFLWGHQSLGLGPVHMTLFYLKYFFKGSISPKQPYSKVLCIRTSAYEFRRDKNQPLQSWFCVFRKWDAEHLFVSGSEHI